MARMIAEDLPALVIEDQAFQDAKRNLDKQNARIEHDKALERATIAL